MKKTHGFFLLCAMATSLVACGKEAPQFEASNFLDSVKQEVGFVGNFTGNFGGASNSYAVSSYFSTDEYYMHSELYEDIMGTPELHYYKNAEGNLYMKSLTLENELKEEVAYYEGSEEVVKFSDYVVNPFTRFTVADVTFANSKVTLAISEENATLVSSDMFGLTLEATSLKVTVNEEFAPVSFELFLKDVNDDGYEMKNMVYSATFASKSSFVPVIEKQAEKGYTELETAFESLARNNYKIELKSYTAVSGNEPVSESSAVVTDKGFIVTDDNSSWGIVELPENAGLAQVEVEGEVGEEYLKATKVSTSYSINDYYSIFKFASASADLFSLKDGKYTLEFAQDELFCICPDQSYNPIYMTGNPLSYSIELGEGSIDVTYCYQMFLAGEVKVVLHVTDIGETSLGFDLSKDVVIPNNPETWAVVCEMFNVNEIMDLTPIGFTAFNSMDDVIPFYYPENGWDEFGVDWFDPILTMTVYTDTYEEALEVYEDADDTMYFGLAFSENGWEDVTIDGTDLGRRFVSVSLGMQIEYFADEDFFSGAYFSIVIQPYQAPVDSTIRVAALTNGAIPTEFEETYTSGDNVEFSIVPNDGYVLASIVDENNDELYIDVSVDDESAANYTYSASFTMPNEDVVLKAVFGHRVLKGSHENGRILDNNKQSGFGYAVGEEVTLVLKGDSGYVPTSASIEGHPEINVDVIEVQGMFGSSYQAKFTMPDFEVTVNAVFTAAEA